MLSDQPSKEWQAEVAAVAAALELVSLCVAAEAGAVEGSALLLVAEAAVLPSALAAAVEARPRHRHPERRRRALTMWQR